MYKLILHPDVKADLKRLCATEPAAGGKIAALLQQISCDQQLLDKLTDHGYGSNHSAEFDVSKWLEFWRKGVDLWRLKIWDLEDNGLKYRIIYFYEPGTREKRYYVLAIMDRDIDYDPEHPITKRVLAAISELGI